MQIIDIYLTAYGGATVWFADNQALQGSLIHTLKVGKPLFSKMDWFLENFRTASYTPSRLVITNHSHLRLLLMFD